MSTISFINLGYKGLLHQPESENIYYIFKATAPYFLCIEIYKKDIRADTFSVSNVFIIVFLNIQHLFPADRLLQPVGTSLSYLQYEP